MAFALWRLDEQSGLGAAILQVGWASAALLAGYAARLWALLGVPVAIVAPMLARHGLALGLESDQQLCDPSCGISPGGAIVLLVPAALVLAGIGALCRVIVTRLRRERNHGAAAPRPR